MENGTRYEGDCFWLFQALTEGLDSNVDLTVRLTGLPSDGPFVGLT